MITIAVTLAELYAAPGNSARSAKRVSGKAPFLWALRRRERASRHSSSFVCLCAKLAFQLGTRCRQSSAGTCGRRARDAKEWCIVGLHARARPRGCQRHEVIGRKWLAGLADAGTYMAKCNLIADASR